MSRKLKFLLMIEKEQDIKYDHFPYLPTSTIAFRDFVLCAGNGDTELFLPSLPRTPRTFHEHFRFDRSSTREKQRRAHYPLLSTPLSPLAHVPFTHPLPAWDNIIIGRPAQYVSALFAMIGQRARMYAPVSARESILRAKEEGKGKK